MNEALYWLWLQKSIGFAEEYSEMISFFGSVKALYEASDEERKECPRLTRRKKVRERMNEYTLADAEKIVETCKKYGIRILTPADADFPEGLRDIPKAPSAIYVRGDIKCLRSALPIAVIGSRLPSKYGEDCATEMVSGLVKKANAVIISGGALGIDSVAHRAALKSGGKTVLVLGCGHGINYLPENSDMRKEISRNGALVTEYPPFTSASPATFPERNRIISGLSKAVVIIEAAERSGTFSTANHAIRQVRTESFLFSRVISKAVILRAPISLLVKERQRPFSALRVCLPLLTVRCARKSTAGRRIILPSRRLTAIRSTARNSVR